MPWSVADVDKHKHGLSPAKKAQWVAVANKVLADTGDDARAIRTANAAVRESQPDEGSLRDELAAEMELAEASGGDHFYGAWEGGSAKSGGHAEKVDGSGAPLSHADAKALKPGDRLVIRGTGPESERTYEVIKKPQQSGGRPLMITARKAGDPNANARNLQFGTVHMTKAGPGHGIQPQTTHNGRPMLPGHLKAQQAFEQATADRLTLEAQHGSSEAIAAARAKERSARYKVEEWMRQMAAPGTSFRGGGPTASVHRVSG